MLSTVLKFAASLISKELLIDLLKEVFLEFAMDLLKEFAKDSKNPYDDKLVEKFSHFLEERED